MATSSGRERVVATRGRAQWIVKNKINGSPALALAHYNLRDAPGDAEPQQEGAARGRAAEQSPQRDGAPAPGNGNKRQKPNPRPDLKRGREEGGSEASAGTRPATRN